jgi:hypothetical protein
VRARFEPAPLVLAAAFPFLFLHRHYQPSVSLGSFDANLSDLAVLAVVVAALRWERPLRLPGPRAVWIAAGALLVWIAVSVVYGRLLDPAYPLKAHAVTAAKFAEYALLAPAAALILRRAEARRLAAAVAIGWCCVLALVALLQFLGVVSEFEGRRPGQREPSLAGIHDLGAFSGTVLALALVAVVLGTTVVRKRAAIAAGVAGAVGVSIAAALDSIGALILSAVTIWLAASRRQRVSIGRTIALVAIVAGVSFAAVTLRASSIQAFLRFVGVEQQAASSGIQTGAHRIVLAYVGVRVWIDHPLLGVGWQGSADPFAFEPVLPKAHERFPSEPAAAFPSPEHPWGVQNGPVQALADLGPVGLLAFLAVFLVPLAAAGRTAFRAAGERAVAALVVSCALIFSLAVITGSGLVTGAPLDALLWLAVGAAAAVASSDTRAPGTV